MGRHRGRDGPAASGLSSRSWGCQAWRTTGGSQHRRQRKRNEGELDGILESWTRDRSAESAMCLLQDVGVPAGAVLTNRQVAENEHFRARGFFQRDAGGRVHLAAPWRFSKVALGVRRFAPELGQDNLHVLRDILGVPEADIRAMERRGGHRGAGPRRIPIDGVAWSTSISHTWHTAGLLARMEVLDGHSQGRTPLCGRQATLTG